MVVLPSFAGLRDRALIDVMCYAPASVPSSHAG
jgi:hypothetical protein